MDSKIEDDGVEDEKKQNEPGLVPRSIDITVNFSKDQVDYLRVQRRQSMYPSLKTNQVLAN